MTFHDRLKAFFKSEGVAIAAVEQRCGFSNGSLRYSLTKHNAIGSDRLGAIFKNFPHLSPTWLFTGKDDEAVITAAVLAMEKTCHSNERTIIELKNYIDLLMTLKNDHQKDYRLTDKKFATMERTHNKRMKTLESK